MNINGIEYKFVVTSANDRDHLTLECTRENEFLLEAVLVSYEEQKANIYVHRNPLPYELIEEFTNLVKQELKKGSIKKSRS